MLQSKAAWKLMHSTTRTAVQDHISFLHCISKNVLHNKNRVGEEQMVWILKAIENNGAKTFLCDKNFIKIVSHWVCGRVNERIKKKTEVENKVILMWALENDRSMVEKINKDVNC